MKTKQHNKKTKIKGGKKIKTKTLLFLLALFGSFCVQAQTTVTIGTGTTANRYAFGMWFGYERSASIYTAAEIGLSSGSTITSLGWYVSTAYTSSATVRIYVANTTATTLTAGTYANIISGATLVYNGTRSFSSTGWNTIATTGFTYTGNNLLVITETTYGGTGTSSYPTFQYTAGTAFEYWYQDNSAPTGSGTINNSYRPNIQITAITPCTNSSLYPSAFAAPTTPTSYTISSCQYQSEYNEMTGVVAGNSYTSTASIAGTYITVRYGSYNGSVVTAGTTPLTWTASAGAGTYFIHYNTNSSCGTASSCMTSTITCNSCEMMVPASGSNSYTTCSGHLYDNGGSTVAYALSSNGYTTIYPATAGNMIQLTGTYYTETNYDYVYIYNGVGITGTLLYSGSASASTSIGTITSTDATGALTVRFTSDGSIQNSGFDFTISCITPCTTPGTPTSISGSGTSATTANLSWAAGSPAGSATVTYYWTLYNSGGTVITSGNTTGTTASVTGLTCNTSYYFAVYASTSCNATSSSVATSGSFSTSACEMIVPSSGTTTYTVCSGHIYDHAGSTTNYSNSISGYAVIYPGDPTKAVQLTGTYDVETCCDHIYIYDGAGTGGSLLGQFQGTGGVSIGTITSSGANVPLTIQFTTDASVIYSGFDFTISCVTPPTPCTNASLPYTEGFNSINLPYCWSQVIVSGSSSFQFLPSSSSPATTPWEGSNYVFWNSWSISSGYEARLISRPITTIGTSNVEVRFFWMNENSSTYNSGSYLLEGVQVQYSLDKITWVNAGSFIPRQDATLTSGTSQWKIKEIPLPAGAGNQSTIYVGFLFHSSYGDNCSMDGVWIGELYTDPLPVELVSFTGHCDGNHVELKWETASEINNDYFTVEKSTDAINWQFVTKVPGAGNSNQLLHYVMTDEATLDEVVYYRLIQTDYNGVTETFPPLTVRCLSENDVKLYPNPVTDILYIEAGNTETEIRYILYDIHNQRIAEGTGQTITMANFAPGVYYIEILFGGKNVFKKIVRQ